MMLMQVDTYADFVIVVNALSGTGTRAVLYCQGGCILMAIIGNKIVQANPYNIEAMNSGNAPTQLATDFPEAKTISFRPNIWFDTDITGLTGGPQTW